ncbi:MAG: hypothetical protein E7624_08625 [Ruminococcaceae bacterium]|nr:hypothetical protein [Oscillospiraceae bacterium]
MKNKVMMVVAVVLLLALGVSLIAFSGKMADQIGNAISGNTDVGGKKETENSVSKDDQNESTDQSNKYLFSVVLTEYAQAIFQSQDSDEAFQTKVMLYREDGEFVTELVSAEGAPVWSWNLSGYVELYYSYYVVGIVYAHDHDVTEDRSDIVVISRTPCELCGSMKSEVTLFCTNPDCENYG